MHIAVWQQASSACCRTTAGARQCDDRQQSHTCCLLPGSRAAPVQLMPASPSVSHGELAHAVPPHASQLASLPVQLMLRSR